MDKKRCIQCNKGWFAGEVGEIQKHLCDKHKKEHIENMVKEVVAYLDSVPKNKGEGIIKIYRKKFKLVKIPRIGEIV